MKGLNTLTGKSCKRLATTASLAALALLWAGFAHGITPYLYLQDPLPFYIERPTVNAFLSIEQENESRSGPFVNSEKDSTSTRQKFDIRTRGWAYHPALVIFNIGLRPEFTQQTEEANSGRQQDDDGTFLGYFLDTTWLQNKPYTINLYTSKDRTDTSSSLALDTSTETTVNRGRLQLKYPVLPTTITVENRETTTDGFFHSSDEQDSIRMISRKETRNSTTTLDIEAREQDRTIDSSTTYIDRFSSFIRNSYRISEKSTLSSGLSYFDSSSTARDTTTSRIHSRLNVRHRKNFSTNYSVRYEQRDETDFSSDSTLLSAGLSHLLYENLTTAFNVSSSRNKLNDGELNSNEAYLDFRYHRRIPWGRINMNLGVRERIEDDQRSATYAQARDESHTFFGISTQIYLDHIAVDVATPITVTDAITGYIYVEGTDFTVGIDGSSTIIERILHPGGIGDDQEVLVTYSYEPDPPAETGLTTITFGTNLYLWDKLNLFYQRSQSKERLISGQEPNELTDDTVQRAGAELKWKWSTSYVEIEDRDTTVTPLQRFLVREKLAFQPTRNLSYGLGAEYIEVELKDTGQVTKATGIDANLSWNVGPRGQLRARTFKRTNRSSFQRSESTGLISIYDWWYGAWRPRIRYEFLDDNNELTGDTRERHIIYFQIERQFR